MLKKLTINNVGSKKRAYEERTAWAGFTCGQLCRMDCGPNVEMRFDIFVYLIIEPA